jgi:thiamine transporter ThiT
MGQLPYRGRKGEGPTRRLLLALILFGTIGLLLELVLLEHVESVWQWIPIAVLAIGLASTAVVAVRPARRTVRVFQAVMGSFVGVGLLGLYLHYQGNAAFEREMDASVRGLALFWRSMRGATPALAPGALAQLGLLGLIQAYRHPALERDPIQSTPFSAPERAGNPR